MLNRRESIPPPERLPFRRVTVYATYVRDASKDASIYTSIPIFLPSTPSFRLRYTWAEKEVLEEKFASPEWKMTKISRQEAFNIVESENKYQCKGSQNHVDRI